MKWRPFRRKRRDALISSAGLIAPVGGPTGATGPTTPGALFAPLSYATSAVSVASMVSMPTDVVQPMQDLGLSIEPIIGLRSFYIDVDFKDPLLLSYNSTCWPHREPLYAICGTDPFTEHEVPHEDCQCGIYAWRKNLTHPPTGKLYGEIYMWGDVLICPDGYRAEIAYPKSLTINSPTTRAIRRMRDGLADAYGIPVTIDDPNMPKVESVEFLRWGTHFQTDS